MCTLGDATVRSESPDTEVERLRTQNAELLTLVEQ
jgi:hypothetical protein